MTEQEKELLFGLAALAMVDAVNNQTKIGRMKFQALRVLLEPFRQEIRERLAAMGIQQEGQTRHD